MAKERARNLDNRAIILIVEILDGWSGKLTWDLLIAAIEVRLNARYTRQALDKRARIKSAYNITKTRLREAPKNVLQSSLSASEASILIQRLNRTEAENVRLKIENEALLEQFVTWAYNAHLKGLTKESLSDPRYSVDRDLTKADRRSFRAKAAAVIEK